MKNVFFRCMQEHPLQIIGEVARYPKLIYYSFNTLFSLIYFLRMVWELLKLYYRLSITAEFLETNILDLRLPFNCLSPCQSSLMFK